MAPSPFWIPPALTRDRIASVPRRGQSALVLHELSVHGVRMARERRTLVVDDAVFYVERPAPGGASRANWGDLVAAKLAALGVPATARVACDALPRVPERGRGSGPRRAARGRPLALGRGPRGQGA